MGYWDVKSISENQTISIVMESLNVSGMMKINIYQKQYNNKNFMNSKDRLNISQN